MSSVSILAIKNTTTIQDEHRFRNHHRLENQVSQIVRGIDRLNYRTQHEEDDVTASNTNTWFLKTTMNTTLSQSYPPTKLHSWVKDHSNTITSGTSTASTPSFKVSLWLLPPEPLRAQLSQQIQTLSYIQNTPSFAPHITLLGGVEFVDSMQAWNHAEYCTMSDLILRDLQKVFHNFGSIPCHFVQERGIQCMYEDTVSPARKVKWNQSCVSVMKRSLEFMNALSMAHRVMNRYSSKKCTLPDHVWNRNQRDFQNPRDCESDEIENQDEYKNNLPSTNIEDHSFGFPPPLNEPHYSFAYGNDETLTKYVSSVPPDFSSHEIVLMKTRPSTLEGVLQWREIGRIHLTNSVK